MTLNTNSHDGLDLFIELLSVDVPCVLLRVQSRFILYGAQSSSLTIIIAHVRRMRQRYKGDHTQLTVGSDWEDWLSSAGARGLTTGGLILAGLTPLLYDSLSLAIA